MFPRQKDAEFDAEGRPYSPFFFTGAPQTTTLLYDLADHIEKVRRHYRDNSWVVGWRGFVHGITLKHILKQCTPC